MQPGPHLSRTRRLRVEPVDPLSGVARKIVRPVTTGPKIVDHLPFLGSETSKLPAGKTLYLPSKNKENWIHISDPLGRDTVIAFAFNKRPFFLNQMIGKEYLDYNGIFSKLIATVEKNPATSAVAVLDLLTVEKLQEE